jgi:ribosomal protein L7/L12
MLAVLDVTDYVVIAVILVAVTAGAGVASAHRFQPSDWARLHRLEAKVDLILRHLGLEYQGPAPGELSAEVKALADDPARKIAAIALHRKETGVGLKEAKDAVEAYLAGRG